MLPEVKIYLSYDARATLVSLISYFTSLHLLPNVHGLS